MSIRDVRKLGREYCQTDGSSHYVKIRENNGIDAIEVAMANGIFEDFAIANIVKYALRFKHTRKLDDLKKVSDYSHILAGVELEKRGREVIEIMEVSPEKAVVTDVQIGCANCRHVNTSNSDYPCNSCDLHDCWEAPLPKNCETCGDRCNVKSFANNCRSHNFKYWQPRLEVTD